jgi:hypothetical protein
LHGEGRFYMHLQGELSLQLHSIFTTKHLEYMSSRPRQPISHRSPIAWWDQPAAHCHL